MAASLRLGFRRFVVRNNLRSVAALHSSVRSYAAPDKVTHTGQQWDSNDYRLARFTDRQKEVNEKFAIDLIDEEPPKEIHGRHVWCDGGGGALGHPKVYINLDQNGPHACGYCGLRFVMAAEHH
ncbi:NADH dehydrogenase [ubiquinone] iron-sulfur protein 6, mitochondrial-like [Orbicella faveolata]|uniref:NADH dehydrogenase [ubiquinone] iron-sulfur protein 6, mitochondrial-like n=1 Tax=Orbicella faveolata TaxID=48498 RepID=UPI0009E5A0B8|nr:NADH dehydrogenase [ubiquinone] iron-sulfur protein 6, mitochondrial-like [Orbicella faveolata]